MTEGLMARAWHKEDKRPACRGWTPGTYANKCRECGCHFIGDKRAAQCADCAYMINAAADMLEALKDAEARMSASPEFNKWDLGPTPTLQKVRAAIAKAEGRS